MRGIYFENSATSQLHWLMALFKVGCMIHAHLKIIYDIYRYRCVNRLTEKAWNYILENFVSMAIESEEFLQLNVDDFYAIINDELLNVKVKGML